MMRNKTFHSILITGASSGVGRVVALYLAAPDVRLFLGGRNQTNLEKVADECKSLGAVVEMKSLDVCDRQGMEEWIYSVGHLDFVLACAGVSIGTVDATSQHTLPESSDKIRQIMRTNIDGVLNTVLPAIEVMRQQNLNSDDIRGRIAAVASVAGFVNSAWAPSYCASKSAVDRFMVSSGGSLEKLDIYLSSICCGFIRTPMTANHKFKMPGLMDADTAAKLIVQGVLSKKRRIIFPVWMVVLARMIDLLPVTLLEKLYLPYLEKNHKN
ncbi:SDR family NAD(P)-dependent oxidoreductase [Commensalibacter nepenthis]|uniref:SDR family NAD(P)-dependent oxidoreductase n=1 Tax=Commensalibacter nepenthis TaxID=3043872 RepID=A0ABT6Q7D3_9PROT|nr:SDR family NAD(P)-dependent oxidoreductase [Commensalibacter sp. TBRC 10068]MDI2112789.1 SDR family NAD(P)-dependent oxidoreductase [Commensalibacter sp. TBRC 10068]